MIVHLALRNYSQGELNVFILIRNKLVQRHFPIGNPLLSYVH